MKYLFYDDETANSQGRICSLGYELVGEDGEVLDSFYTLVDPQSNFQSINIAIHGIKPDDVIGAPTFEELYKTRLAKLFDECVFVSHHAKGADLVHIRNSLAAYDIESPEIKFIDTLDHLAKNLFEKGQRGLDSVCEHYGIDVGRHHHALDDARACKEIFYCMTQELGIPEFETRPAGYTGSSHVSRRPSNVIYGSDETFFDILDQLEEEGLRGDLSEVGSIENMKIVVTGYAEGYTRETIKEALAARKAKPTGSVSKKTTFLAIGPNASPGKIDDARKNNVPVVSTEELVELLDRISL